MGWLKRRRRRALAAEPFPAAWSEILDRTVPYQRLLSEEDRAELRRETDDYPLLDAILVYPSAYAAPMTESMGRGVIREGVSARLGESWQSGAVVLSWDDVLRGAADIHDGGNVVLHEFAHQLDQEGGSDGGAPILPKRSMYVAWARVLGEEYTRLKKDSVCGRKNILDAYGATNPAEFFAVATEVFFEKGASLRLKHPELYEELKLYYRQDPASLPPSD